MTGGTTCKGLLTILDTNVQFCFVKTCVESTLPTRLFNFFFFGLHDPQSDGHLCFSRIHQILDTTSTRTLRITLAASPGAVVRKIRAGLIP